MPPQPIRCASLRRTTRGSQSLQRFRPTRLTSIGAWHRVIVELHYLNERRNFNLPPWPAAVGPHSMGSATVGGKPSAASTAADRRPVCHRGHAQIRQGHSSDPAAPAAAKDQARRACPTRGRAVRWPPSLGYACYQAVALDCIRQEPKKILPRRGVTSARSK